MLIIGSGPNRIGQGIEFDYCCVQAVKTLRAKGYETIMVNCNPETVSTDYDMVDRLYCTPLTLEDVLEIIALEKPLGVFVQYGGQTPLQLADGLAAAGVPLLGVDISAIEITEDRQKFQQLVQTLHLKQPKNHCVYQVNEDLEALDKLNFPLIVRPSFVLGGRAMAIVNNSSQLQDCLAQAFLVNDKHPILVEEFLQNAIEVDVEAIADGIDVFIPGLLEHIETAGVHSGDSACITPPVQLTLAMQLAIKQEVSQIAKHLNLRGVFNVQFAIQNNDIYILEVNPRASRTLPFLSKATGLPLIHIATCCVLGETLASQGIKLAPELPCFYVKEAVLPFAKFPNASALLGPEMKSTGEVMGIGATPEEAYAKAQIAAGNHLPQPGIVWLIASDLKAPELSPLITKLNALGFVICSEFNAINSAIQKNHPLQQQANDVEETNLPSLSELASPCVLIIALTDNAHPDAFATQALRFAIDHSICHVTSLPAAQLLLGALETFLTTDYSSTSVQNLYQQQKHLQPTKHLLTGEELSAEQIQNLLTTAIALKQKRSQNLYGTELKGYHLALLFDKPSFRTRCSFTIAMRELGGEVIESVSDTRKTELPTDQAQVLNGYCQAIMIRTHQDSILEEMRQVSQIPIINGLSDWHHPCQIFADLLTLLEIFGSLSGLTLTYIGDGNNILHSLLLLAPQLGVNVHYCCPPTRGPDATILARSLARTTQHTGQIQAFSSPETAVVNAHAIYTDVWTSMGFEEKSADHLFNGFQVNEHLMQKALPQTVFMHCLPMNRGQEVSDTLPDLPCSVIFRQSENRLHVQKALLLYLLKGV
jgi:carbamoyl-phosphate synthase large subunit